MRRHSLAGTSLGAWRPSGGAGSVANTATAGPAASEPPAPSSSGGIPWFLIGGLAVAAGAVYMIAKKR